MLFDLSGFNVFVSENYSWKVDLVNFFCDSWKKWDKSKLLLCFNEDGRLILISKIYYWIIMS